jgi:hypothetical protein
MGVSSVPVSTDASAVVGPGTGVMNVRPVGICEERAAQAAASVNGVHSFPLDKADSVCDLNSNTWGILNFAGSKGNKNFTDCDDPNDGNEYAFNCGHYEPVSPGWVDGSPGLKNSLGPDIITMVGKDVVFPVYDEYDGKKYHISGFLTVRVCAVHTKNKGSKFEAPCAVGAEETMTFIYKRFTPVADLNTSCALATACDFGTRVVKLAD